MPPNKRLYVAIFLDAASKEALLKAMPPKHVNVYAEHMTLAFGRHMQETYPVGEEFELEVIALYEDERGQAVTVKGTKAKQWVWVEQIPHITISCAVGIKPFYSADLIKQPNPKFIFGFEGMAPGLKLTGVLDYFPRTPREATNADVPVSDASK